MSTVKQVFNLLEKTCYVPASPSKNYKTRVVRSDHAPIINLEKLLRFGPIPSFLKVRLQDLVKTASTMKMFKEFIDDECASGYLEFGLDVINTLTGDGLVRTVRRIKREWESLSLVKCRTVKGADINIDQDLAIRAKNYKSKESKRLQQTAVASTDDIIRNMLGMDPQTTGIHYRKGVALKILPSKDDFIYDMEEPNQLFLRFGISAYIDGSEIYGDDQPAIYRDNPTSIELYVLEAELNIISAGYWSNLRYGIEDDECLRLDVKLKGAINPSFDAKCNALKLEKESENRAKVNKKKITELPSSNITSEELERRNNLTEIKKAKEIAAIEDFKVEAEEEFNKLQDVNNQYIREAALERAVAKDLKKKLRRLEAELERLKIDHSKKRNKSSKKAKELRDNKKNQALKKGQCSDEEEEKMMHIDKHRRDSFENQDSEMELIPRKQYTIY